MLRALDVRTGAVRWEYDIRKDGDQKEFHGDALLTDDLLIIGTDGPTMGHVYAFERKDGTVRWKYPVQRKLEARVGVPYDILRDGSRIDTVATPDELLSLDIATGKLLWNFKTGVEKPGYWSSPGVANGRVFFAGQDGFVRAFNDANGKLIWKTNVGAPPSTSLALGDGAVFVGTVDGRLHRLDQKRGREAASFDLHARPQNRPAIIGDLLVVFAGIPIEQLTAIDLKLTKARWTVRMPEEWTSSSRPQLWHGVILAGNGVGKVFGLDPRDGSTRWSESLQGMIRGIGTDDKTLYVGTLRGRLYAFTPPE